MGSGESRGYPVPHNRSELLEIVRNRKLSWVERGQAVDELCQAELEEETIAGLTGVSKETINKQKICFRNLHGTASEMCRSRKMKADAACRLAHAVSKDANLNEERVMMRASALSKDRDSERLKKGRGVKGRRTLVGQITDEDMKTALSDEYPHNA